MPYRHLHFRSLAKDLSLRTEIYNGEEHLVVPCIALVGDEVVYGMNAEGPEFIPAEELEFSTLGWSGRPVLPDHPANSTSTANDPHTLQLMQFGQIFYPRFEDKKLKIEAWLGRERAKKVTGAIEIIEKVEAGEIIELSVGAIISLERRNGVSPSGKPYQAVWHDVQSDHLAIGLNGSQGACNLEMGCGANRTLADNNRLLTSNSESAGESDVRMMHAERGDANMTPKPDDNPAAQPAVDIQPIVKAQSRVQKILSFASRLFRTNIEDEGLSDSDLRNKLWDVLYSSEPAFYGIEDVFQESMTVNYVTQPIVPVPTMYLWRRTFSIADDGAVTINDDREEVSRAENSYMFLSSPAERVNSQPCACQETNSNPQTQTLESKEDDTMADAPKTTTTTTDPSPTTPATTPTTPTTPAAPAVPTPEKGSSEAATPSQSGNEDKAIPNYPAGVPNPENEVPGSPTAEQLKALLEEHPLVKKYRAQEAQEKSYLVSALGKAQKVYSADQLNAMSVDQLRPIAQLVGVSGQAQQPAGDFSGRMMVAYESELPPPPDPWGVAKHLKRGGDSAN